ncbi:MAG: isoprenylcysteine carboxylmethyltransferase family protein [Dysgonamonadaceae bacterium]|jgi:protein-S-isoprenylcysteine O-methyltransferase Ste14|nr:isoprenylcysteine carboxylmethyltransferase family protein [Dysgonamonadaceae bacterium]
MTISSILVLTSLALFNVLFIGRTVMLYRQGVKVWTIGTSGGNILERLLENVLTPFLLLWNALIIMAVFHAPFLSDLVLDVTWLKYAGIALCYCGLAIFLWALVSFGKSWRIGIDEKTSNELITTGAFRYSRNPIFLFMDMYFAGVMLAFPNVIIIILTVCSIVGIHFQILREEKFLFRKFGSKYNEYQRQTRRYI